MPIIVTKRGKDARRLERQSFEQETKLQKYISDNPECIPIRKIGGDNTYLPHFLGFSPGL